MRPIAPPGPVLAAGAGVGVLGALRLVADFRDGRQDPRVINFVSNYDQGAACRVDLDLLNPGHG